MQGKPHLEDSPIRFSTSILGTWKFWCSTLQAVALGTGGVLVSRGVRDTQRWERTDIPQ